MHTHPALSTAHRVQRVRRRVAKHRTLCAAGCKEGRGWRVGVNLTSNDAFPANGNTRNRLAGTNCAEIAVSCTGFRGPVLDFGVCGDTSESKSTWVTRRCSRRREATRQCCHPLVQPESRHKKPLVSTNCTSNAYKLHRDRGFLYMTIVRGYRGRRGIAPGSRSQQGQRGCLEGRYRGGRGIGGR
eukprot:2126526-Rhodomonas_salina.1